MATADIKKPSMSPPIPPIDGRNNVVAASPARIPTVELKGLVGFSSLPDQLVHKAKKNGFIFNIICVGETGIGKSTLIESLFSMDFNFEPCSYELTTVELRPYTFEIQEGGVRLKLTVVETAGFGDKLDKENSVQVIIKYINEQFESYLQEELKIKRCLKFFSDSRIHACLYFISPTGHGLKTLDVVALKELCRTTNVIPIIAKADTVSKEELKRFKSKILTELKTNGIEIYRFPEDDETFRDQNEKLNAAVPFAVVGSTNFVKKGDKSVRARQYPWGIVEVENEEHCDFVKLREALLRVNIEDLRERTHRVFYESYRRSRLLELGVKDGDLGPVLFQSFQARRNAQLASLRSKENEMHEKFVQRVKAKEQELKDKEKEMQQKNDHTLAEYQAELHRLQEESKLLEKACADFQNRKTQFLSLKRKK